MIHSSYKNLLNETITPNFPHQINNITRIQTLPPPPPQKRNQSQVGTFDYQRSLRRAFARGKLLAFFNPDLTHFITLTYKGSDHTPEQVIQHIKYLVKKHNQKRPKSYTVPKLKQLQLNNDTTSWKPFKYIYVMEYQKRGSIHVHMIANDALDYELNSNGYLQLKDWSHGFTSVLTIEGADENFKPYLYLFKYMSKAQRIGASFIHTSKNFDKIETIDYHTYIEKLTEENLLFTEDQEFFYDNTKHRVTKEYFKTQ